MKARAHALVRHVIAEPAEVGPDLGIRRGRGTTARAPGEMRLERALRLRR